LLVFLGVYPILPSLGNLFAAQRHAAYTKSLLLSIEGETYLAIPAVPAVFVTPLAQMVAVRTVLKAVLVI